ncbi:MAG: hypothetical protein NTW87_17735 [Planctomycetota bacterium]|nr:hypothetical protein [Planctomycetota bacterium]
MLSRSVLVAFVGLLFLAPVLRAAQDTKLLLDFEDEKDVKLWEFKKSKPELVADHATHGQKCLKIAPDEYMVSFRLPKDWSGYDSLDLDVFVDGDGPVAGYLFVGDEQWKNTKGGTYWNRHNGGFNLKPGANTVSIPVNGLYRGEAGSRGNDLKSNIDPKQIVRMDLGFTPKAAARAIFIDYMRLVKESRPAGILAFDFGPPSQVLSPGFTAITWNTVYGQGGATAGLRRATWGPNSARDDTFPTRLYQDFVALDDNEFVCDAPNGKCHVWLVFDDLGYWGGEQTHCSKRSIECAGTTAWSEERSPADYLFHFETVEPKPGDSVWDLYMKYLFAPKRFEATAADGKLSLRFKGDAPWSCRVAGMIAYPDAQKAEGDKFVTEIEDRNRKEFEARAAYLGPKEDSRGTPNTSEERVGRSKAFSLEEDISVASVIEKGVLLNGDQANPKAQLYRVAARGQRISFTFAIRPEQEPLESEVHSKAGDMVGPSGRIPASRVDLRYVHHATHRGFNDIAYTIGPETLRRIQGSGLRLQPHFTRQFWVTVDVPLDAKPGTYACQLVVSQDKLAAYFTLAIEVLDLTLDEPDFLMGFYGFHIPNELPAERKKTAMRELFTVLKQNGMNSVSGGPGIKFSGFDDAGKPKLDFADCDEFFKTYKECGFTKPVVAYGGPGMVQGLHDGYVVGETGRNWEKKTGKPFGELLKIVWGAVKEHAEKEGWPPIYYEFNDEPRVVEVAKEQLALQKLYREHAPWVKIGGSYSLRWDTNDPLESTLQETFKTFVWSALNAHTQVDLDKTKEFGRELQIYNQGVTRYSFGAYQWAEYRKGVTGRMQWHLLALHGYQFFDLDGREPDTAMINWGRNEIIPTLRLARCREGADDFRFAVTLWNMAQKKKDAPEGKAAIAFLDDVSAKIGVGQNERPKGFMDDETFRNTCIEHIKKLQAAK